MSSINYFSTQSLALATALQVASLAKLETIDFSQSDQRANFYFDRSKDPQLDTIIARFWARQLPIDGFSYFESLKYLKSRLYEVKHAQ